MAVVHPVGIDWVIPFRKAHNLAKKKYKCGPFYAGVSGPEWFMAQKRWLFLLFNVWMECSGVGGEEGAYLIVDKKYYVQGETFVQN